MSKLVSPYEALAVLTDEYERQLIERHPRLNEYLNMTILARPMWGGGWDVLGEICADEKAAIEAKRAAIMGKLIAADKALR